MHTLPAHKEIHRWMADVIQRAGYERFEDLHIDDVDPKNRARETWLRVSTEYLAFAASARDQARWPFQVALGMSLRSSPTPLGLNFATFADIVHEFDWSPPSLYLFPAGDNSWLGGSESQQLPAQYAPQSRSPLQAYLREWHDTGDGEYRRTYWVVA
jgi:hypothetical protein